MSARPSARRSNATAKARGNGHLRQCWHCKRQRQWELMRRLVRGLWVCQDKPGCLAARIRYGVPVTP